MNMWREERTVGDGSQKLRQDEIQQAGGRMRVDYRMVTLMSGMGWGKEARVERTKNYKMGGGRVAATSEQKVLNWLLSSWARQPPNLFCAYLASLFTWWSSRALKTIARNIYFPAGSWLQPP